MRKELYNCIQARWLPTIASKPLDKPDTEELMYIINFTNYDILYALMEGIEVVRKIIIYPYQCYSVRRIKNNQYAVLTVYDGHGINIRIDRKLITNRLITLVSSKNPYKYAPGVLGWLERKYIEHLLPKSDFIHLDTGEYHKNNQS